MNHPKSMFQLSVFYCKSIQAAKRWDSGILRNPALGASRLSTTRAGRGGGGRGVRVLGLSGSRALEFWFFYGLGLFWA